MSHPHGRHPGVLLGQLAPVWPSIEHIGVGRSRSCCNEFVSYGEGAAPKEISRALRVPPAKVAPLVRLVAAQNTELQRRPDVVECWVNPGMAPRSHIRATPGLVGQSQRLRRHGRAGHGDGSAPRPAIPKPSCACTWSTRSVLASKT